MLINYQHNSVQMQNMKRLCELDFKDKGFKNQKARFESHSLFIKQGWKRYQVERLHLFRYD